METFNLKNLESKVLGRVNDPKERVRIVFLPAICTYVRGRTKMVDVLLYSEAHSVPESSPAFSADIFVTVLRMTTTAS